MGLNEYFKGFNGFFVVWGFMFHNIHDYTFYNVNYPPRLNFIKGAASNC